MRHLEATYGFSADEVERLLHEQFRAYRATLRDDQRRLLERFELVDVARKVVGVGSVGTRAFIALLRLDAPSVQTAPDGSRPIVWMIMGMIKRIRQRIRWQGKQFSA